MKAIKSFASAAILLCITQSVEATPMTLAFEAEVASIGAFGGGVDLPFDIDIGDIITVSFSTGSAAAELHIWTSEFSLEKPNYGLVIEDNARGWIPFSGRIADPANTPIVDRGPAGASDLVDFVQIECAGPHDLSTCESTPLSTEDFLVWFPRILLAGESNVLSGGEVPIDTSVLNALTFREMSLNFVDSDSGSVTTVGAFVGEIYAIPEPPSARLSGLCLSIALLYSIATMHRATHRNHRSNCPSVVAR